MLSGKFFSDCVPAAYLSYTLTLMDTEFGRYLVVVYGIRSQQQPLVRYS